MARASTSLARKAVLGMAAAAAIVTSASAADFTQDDCKVIRGTAGEVVRPRKERLSLEFRQSLVNWMGPGITCDGPKEIIIVSHDDSVAYGTIRSALLAGSKPLSLEKAGLRVIVREKTSAATPPVQRRSDAAGRPAVN